MVRAGLATVSNKLESTNDLANGEESKTLGGDNTTGSELGGAEVLGLLDEGLGRLDQGPVLNGLEQVLVVGLEGGGRTKMCAVRISDLRLVFGGIPWFNRYGGRKGIAYGGLIFWPWKTSLLTSMATLE